MTLAVVLLQKAENSTPDTSEANSSPEKWQDWSH